MITPAPLKRKAILITGAAKRIGRGLALGFAQKGYDIFIHVHSSISEAIELQEEIRGLGVNCEIIRGDLSSSECVSRMIDEARELIDRPLFGLINCASVFEPDSASDFTIEQFEMHQKVNLLAPLLLAKSFNKQCNGSEGVILNILDQRVFRPNPLFFTYSLSKMGLMAATKTMAQEFAPNIRVNAIAPGPTIKNIRQSDEDFKAQCKASLLQNGSPLEDILDAALYLFEAKSVTGQIIAVDGGQSLIWQTPDIEGIME